ncbi:glycosyl transferase [Mesorhizobium hungaricum]|jgi:MGT family glycosyltransferase|uniref:Glycosyl transferase n=1 Tax=Mesorhizobium hungaricum TaxID=1566387 RepID=A0A1C2DN04_9HYPH|nr:MULTISPECIES: glycosyltransferase [Mesorhizobium]MBN9237023.1 glycosyltransferase family 1 protein [Mesorhizobium sp.]OCX16144.1 glycosyl transferase [Mesorhizobium hungaricum]
MKARSYLFALVDQGGNIPPEIGAVRRLVERGHRVVAIGDDSVADDIRASGATFRPWVTAPNKRDRRPQSDWIRDWECKYPWELVKRLADAQMVGPAPRYAADVMDILKESRPDVVVCSMFCVGAMIAAEAARIPFALLFPNVYPIPAEGMPPFGTGLMPARSFAGRWRDRTINTLANYLWNRYALTGHNALRAAYGLSPLSRFFDQPCRASRQLIMTSPSFDFPAALPPGASYVGPILDDPLWAKGEGWEPPGGTGPLVVVSLSTTYQDHIAVLQRIVEALETLPVRGAVATGPTIAPETLSGAPNVSVVESLPHGIALTHADLVVSHGGHGTAIKALANGVPMVILPHGRDQADTAARVSARGAGITLSKASRVSSIAAAIKTVLDDPQYRIAAQRLGKVIVDEMRPEALALSLEDVAEHPLAPRLSPC